MHAQHISPVLYIIECSCLSIGCMFFEVISCITKKHVKIPLALQWGSNEKCAHARRSHTGFFTSSCQSSVKLIHSQTKRNNLLECENAVHTRHVSAELRLPNLLNYSSLEMFLLGQLDGETFDRTTEDTTLAAQAKLKLADDAEKKSLIKQKLHNWTNSISFPLKQRGMRYICAPPTPTLMLIWCWDVGQPALPDSPGWTVLQQKVLNVMITATVEREEQTQKCFTFFRQQNQVNTHVAV